jgi:hypothetical protein
MTSNDTTGNRLLARRAREYAGYGDREGRRSGFLLAAALESTRTIDAARLVIAQLPGSIRPGVDELLDKLTRNVRAPGAAEQEDTT